MSKKDVSQQQLTPTGRPVPIWAESAFLRASPRLVNSRHKMVLSVLGRWSRATKLC